MIMWQFLFFLIQQLHMWHPTRCHIDVDWVKIDQMD